jgi:hypothetical protein
MKMTKQIIAATIMGSLGTAYFASAADTPNNSEDSTLAYPLYQAQELSADLFGSGSVGQQTLDHLTGHRITHDGLVGGGGGLTYFFLRYLGVGGDFDAEGRGGRFFDSASGNIYARLPIGDTGLAPYLFGGGGYQFKDVKQSFGQAGAGMESANYRDCGTHFSAEIELAYQPEAA